MMVFILGESQVSHKLAGKGRRPSRVPPGQWRRAAAHRRLPWPLQSVGGPTQQRVQPERQDEIPHGGNGHAHSAAQLAGVQSAVDASARRAVFSNLAGGAGLRRGRLRRRRRHPGPFGRLARPLELRRNAAGAPTQRRHRNHRRIGEGLDSQKWQRVAAAHKEIR